MLGKVAMLHAPALLRASLHHARVGELQLHALLRALHLPPTGPADEQVAGAVDVVDHAPWLSSPAAPGGAE